MKKESLRFEARITFEQDFFRFFSILKNAIFSYSVLAPSGIEEEKG